MTSPRSRQHGPLKSLAVRSMVILAVVVSFSLGTAGWSQAPGVGGKRGVDVATVNLYVGADVALVLTLDPNDPAYVPKFLSGVATIYNHIVASDYPKRADALARQIVERAPDIIALQEVSLLRSRPPGASGPALHVELDFLAILLEALRFHGGHYTAAAQILNTDVQAPLAIGPPPFADIRLTDRDVILVRTDLPPGQLRTSNPQCRNFTVGLTLPTGLNILRSWCSLDVQLRGRSFRFINTHLEDAVPAPLASIQLAQAAELLAVPADTSLPVVLAGDFNSDAYGQYGPATYALLTTTGGLKDAWSVAHPNTFGGLTWGHDELLSNPSIPFVLRVDLVLYRGSQFKAIGAEVVDPKIDVSPPLWFSDHGGLFTTFAIN